METIDKKSIPGMPDLFKVSTDRKCENCVAFNGDDWCLYHKHPTSAIKYGCRTHHTQAELDEKLKREQAKLQAEDGLRVNYMLTLMFAYISAAYQIMIRSEAIVGKLIGGKDWRMERKKAMKDMMSAIEKFKTLYSRYFEQDYIQMMSDYGRESFDVEKYDGFQMFSGDILALGLTVFEHAYHNNEILHEIIAEIRKRPHDLNLFKPEFVDQFKIRNND
jgi:hypothetical protein